MDRASQVLAQDLPPGVRRTYAALAEHGDVALSTLHHRARGRRSNEQKAQGQQYLTPSEEKAVVKFLLHMSDLAQPVRIKYIPSLAFSVTSQRSATDRPLKPPGRNWARFSERRHPVLKARRVRALDWNRHPNNIYDKITHWFEVIGKALQDPAILPENVYNMDETGVVSSRLGCVKVERDAMEPKDSEFGLRPSVISDTVPPSLLQIEGGKVMIPIPVVFLPDLEG